MTSPRASSREPGDGETLLDPPSRTARPRLDLDLELDAPERREITAVLDQRSPARLTLGPRIALGGMAEVLQAHDAAGRPCVIKRVRPELRDDAEVRALFREEVRLSRRLDHPHVVRALAHADDFIALEWVDGPTLRELAQDLGDALPRAAILEIARDVAAALAYAHALVDEAGRPLELVHRDVSPENVLLGPDGAKLADFGIARFQGRHHHTAIGVLKGKPRYMAPEQRAGEGVDGRADVYALGCIVEELLGGATLDPELDALVARMTSPVAYDRPDARAAHAALAVLAAGTSGTSLGEVLALRRTLGRGSSSGAVVETTRADAAPPGWVMDGSGPGEAASSGPGWVADDWDETAQVVRGEHSGEAVGRERWSDASDAETPATHTGTDAARGAGEGAVAVAPSWTGEDALTAVEPARAPEVAEPRPAVLRPADLPAHLDAVRAAVARIGPPRAELRAESRAVSTAVMRREPRPLRSAWRTPRRVVVLLLLLASAAAVIVSLRAG